ncbi:zinc ribbon domain-containing protein [Nocardia sp. NBC_01388]|uniref:zinc ribbon domain-containing protein n=1 Tax=Nocardia sp. NBC_01388 TaxID=2903596 RepID=UPI00386404DB
MKRFEPQPGCVVQAYRYALDPNAGQDHALRSHCGAARAADAGFGEIRRQLTYKAGWGGSTVFVADRWFASSKTCSGCGAVKAKLPLHVRVFDCDDCPLVLDRDVNAAHNLAAHNLAALAARCTAGSGVAADLGASALKPRGADRKTRATTRRCPTGGRAGGETPRSRDETRDRHQGTEPCGLR